MREHGEPRLRIVLYYPYTRDLTAMDISQVRHADLVIGYGNVVLKDPRQPVPYTVTDEELQRIQAVATDFRRLES